MKKLVNVSIRLKLKLFEARVVAKIVWVVLKGI